MPILLHESLPEWILRVSSNYPPPRPQFKKMLTRLISSSATKYLDVDAILIFDRGEKLLSFENNPVTSQVCVCQASFVGQLAEIVA